MLKQFWNNIPKWLKNRYSITLLLFIVWMTFFDRNDFISQVKLKNRYYKVLNEQQYYRDQIKETQADLDNLLNDDEKLERFARERYLMKKEDEDLFIIVEE